jgi:hypothetical protein
MNEIMSFEEILGREYEEWLDLIEPTLPPIIFEEEEAMDNEKLLKIKQIHERLSKLEDLREERLIEGLETFDIDLEMSELRSMLESIMNDVCPVIRES